MVNLISPLTGMPEAFAVFYIAFLTLTVSAFALASIVLIIISYWKIFEKGGEAGWKCLIPFYSSYILFKITWKTSKFWLVLAISIITSVLFALCPVFIYKAPVVSLIFAILGLAGTIALVVYDIKASYKLSKAFGHGAGFTLGLIFFNFAFILMLGIGKEEYVGTSD